MNGVTLGSSTSADPQWNLVRCPYDGTVKPTRLGSHIVKCEAQQDPRFKQLWSVIVKNEVTGNEEQDNPFDGKVTKRHWRLRRSFSPLINIYI